MSWAGTIAMGQKFVKLLCSLDLNRRVDRVRIENAIMTLRRITFYSSELTVTLKEIAEGKTPDPDAVSYFAHAYAPGSEDEPESRERFLELEYIDALRFKTSSALSIRELELMSQVRWGKLDARRHIQSFFANCRSSSKTRKAALKKEAKAVLEKIDLLNKSIIELEGILLKARKGEETSSPPPPGHS